MRQQHELIQGSPEWHQFRLEHFGASEAAAMLGLSPNVKRNELLRMKSTGIAKEFSDWVQEHILDNGHAVEALARPMAEAIIGDDLYPATYSDGKLSASCDGLTMDDATAFEHKQHNAALAAAVRAGTLPDEYQPQCQQVMLVTGATRLLFMVSDGTPDNCAHLWVTPDAGWQKTLTLGWNQFAEDLANYTYVEEAPKLEGKAPETLPALRIELTGMVTASNLVQFKESALSVIESVKTDLQTDSDFADAEKAVKWCDDVETRVTAAKQHALSQTASIDELFRALDEIKELARVKRLNLEKLVKARKESIRVEIQQAGQSALAQHLAALTARIGKPYLPTIAADFAGVMKGKKTVASLRDAVDTELAKAKINSNEVADKIQTNLNSLRELAAAHAFLFSDTPQIVMKANDDLVALIKMRIAEHAAAEEKRLEAERARIREEEQAKLKAEQDAKDKAEAERVAAAMRATEAAERERLADEDSKNTFAKELRITSTKTTHAEPQATATPQAPAAIPQPVTTLGEVLHAPEQVIAAVVAPKPPLEAKMLMLVGEIEKLPSSKQRTKLLAMANYILLDYVGLNQSVAAG